MRLLLSAVSRPELAHALVRRIPAHRNLAQVYTYVGEPLQLPVISEPTKEQAHLAQSPTRL
eukprot:943176-Pleurochrysis_carterae.AAC.1